MEEEEYKEITDIKEYKTSFIIKKVECYSIENCKPIVASSILFVCVSIITAGIMIYFCLKSRNRDVLHY